jgi:uncharacterized protein YdhG (YjbR/CyaY superfamily)
MMRGAPAKTIDDYLAPVPGENRAALERLRKIIHTAAPKAVEAIGYGMPIFRRHGMLVGFAAFKAHCSFFPMSVQVMLDDAAELSGYETAKGTIRFQPSKPLPVALVKRMVKARIAENESKRPKRK